MAITHKAFLLDAYVFKQRIAPLLTHLDADSAKPLFEAALDVVENTDPNNWILANAGSRLSDIRALNFIGLKHKEPLKNRLESASMIPPNDLGYWCLLIFSTFLRDCSGIGENYSILEWSLNKLGFKPQYSKLLYEGIPTSTLLKDNVKPSPRVVSNSDPYWYWMRPSHSKGGGGWLSQELIRELYDQLKSLDKAVANFDPKLFGNLWGHLTISVPDGQLDYYKRLQIAHEQAKAMLETAQREKTELYMVLSYT